MNEEDPLFLNRLIVVISQARATTLMTSFTKADRVGVQAPDGRMLEGRYKKNGGVSPREVRKAWFAALDQAAA